MLKVWQNLSEVPKTSNVNSLDWGPICDMKDPKTHLKFIFICADLNSNHNHMILI